MTEREGALQRLYDAAEFGDFLAPVIESPQCKEWFATQEKRFVEKMLGAGPADDDLLRFGQISVLAFREFRKWMENGVSAGKLAKKKLMEDTTNG